MSWREKPPAIAEREIGQTYTADVIVVGLGYAGTAALRAAAEQGASVIGLEILSEKAYHTFGRDVGHINSRFLKSRGIPPVDELEFFNEWMARSGNRAAPRLIRRYVRASGSAFDWFTDMYGIDGLKDVHVAFWPDASLKFDGAMGANRFWRGTAQFPEPRGWSGHPTLTEVTRANQAKAKQLGAQLFFGVDVCQIELEGKRPVAVIGKTCGGNFIRYRADQAIILAAGDFSGNPEMLADLVVDMADQYPPGQGFRRMMGRDGRGIQLGLWAGGRLEPRPIPTMGGNYNTLVGVTGTFGVLWLDPDGRRYCNESFGDPVFCGFPGTRIKRGTYYHVFDSNIWACLEWSPPAHGSFDRADTKQVETLRTALAGAVDAGPSGIELNAFGQTTHLVAGNTLEELADRARLPEQVRKHLIASVVRYNDLCASGRDDDFGKDPKMLLPLTQPPYFLQTHPYQGPGSMLVTAGGLMTDEYQNVLDADLEPIPGLYATGNCCGSRFGTQYTTPISGVSIGIALTLGWLCGQDAVSCDGSQSY